MSRAELAKSLKAYVKNHFSTGISSVTTSQYPLLPPQPEPTPVPETKDAETESAPVEAQEEPVTDVVDEQVGSGEVEPVPTPAVGGEAEHPAEEVTEEGGVEQVDEELKELKVEGGEAKAAESTEVPVAEEAQVDATEGDDIVKEAESSTPQVTEETTEVEPESVAPVAEPRKQERVEKPTYTLETVGNKYNTGNFWYVKILRLCTQADVQDWSLANMLDCGQGCWSGQWYHSCRRSLL